MRTINISTADEVELKLIKDFLTRLADAERHDQEKKSHTHYQGGTRFSDTERDARKHIELINRLLSDSPCEVRPFSWLDAGTVKPDENISVLVTLADGEIALGYLEAGEWLDSYLNCGFSAPVAYWADVPEVPREVVS
jgi:hypothetical protein